MSNLGPLTGPAASRVPTPPRGETIARYETYLEAQRAVDYLSDQQFPVQFVTIVGTGLRMVERVTGRLTYPRVAGASALSGLYFGFFVGLALSLFGGGGTDLSILAVAFVGAGFGMLFGIISYGMTRGRRDFTSTSQIVASEYEVLCMPEQAQHARELLWQLPGGRGREQSTTAPGPNPGQPGGPYPGGPYPGGPYPGGPYPGGQPGAGPYPGSAPTGPFPPPTGYPTPGTPPAGQPEPGAPGVRPPAAGPESTQITGPTYGEMMERRRQEQRAREAAEREATARAEAEQTAAEQVGRDRARQDPGQDEGPDRSGS